MSLFERLTAAVATLESFFVFSPQVSVCNFRRHAPPGMPALGRELVVATLQNAARSRSMHQVDTASAVSAFLQSTAHVSPAMRRNVAVLGEANGGTRSASEAVRVERITHRSAGAISHRDGRISDACHACRQKLFVSKRACNRGFQSLTFVTQDQ